MTFYYISLIAFNPVFAVLFVVILLVLGFACCGVNPAEFLVKTAGNLLGMYTVYKCAEILTHAVNAYLSGADAFAFYVSSLYSQPEALIFLLAGLVIALAILTHQLVEMMGVVKFLKRFLPMSR